MNKNEARIILLLGKFQHTLSPNVTAGITEKHNIEYAEVLSDIDAETVAMALKQLSATSVTFYPSAAVIRDKCIELSLPDVPDHGEAWGKIQKTIERYGYLKIKEQGISFGHPVIDEAVKYIGLNELCYSTDSNLFPRFRDVYNMLSKRKMDDAKMLPEVREYRAQLVGEQMNKLSKQLGE